MVIADALLLTAAASAPTSANTPVFVHPDHLGTPQVMTDATQKVVWQARFRPFGQVTLPLQQVENPQRFPGQYYDAESGLHYNYFRDYDPQTGRYVQSDPVGLAGGVNTYGYVGGNPVSYSDPFGLFAPTEPALLTCVAGGPANPACSGAIIVNACKWIGIGLIAILSFYSGEACGGGSGSSEDQECYSCNEITKNIIKFRSYAVESGGIKLVV